MTYLPQKPSLKERLVSAALAYHHAKDREESKRLKLKFIEACANYENQWGKKV